MHTHVKNVNKHRQKYINKIFHVIQKHETTLYAKYCQLVTEDDYGYERYEKYIEELNYFAVDIILKRELIHDNPLNDKELSNMYFNFEKSLLKYKNFEKFKSLVIFYPCFRVDFFNFYITPACDNNADIKIANENFYIGEDVYFETTQQIDEERENILNSNYDLSMIAIKLEDTYLQKYRVLNVCNIVRELVFELYIPNWKIDEDKQHNITPLDYEKNISTQLKSMGFNARTTKGSGDQGADVLATKNGISFAIQCKRYSKPVGNKAVQEANAGRDFYKKDFGVVVSNAGFTKSAKQAAHACGIILLNDKQLNQLLKYTDK